MRVLVAGGGIGGLTTALCLHEAGIDAVVYEAAPAMRELGVGIDLLPHAVARGRSLINWVAEIRDESKTDWRREDWDRVGRKADFVPAFRDWRFDWLDVPRLFRESDRVFKFPMADRDPLAQWSFGRVTLLGDAAHPMYPSGSNGAAQAILDAGALTRALQAEPSVQDALCAYQAERLTPTSEIVLLNREFAAERVLRLVDELCPPDCENIGDYVALDEMEEMSRRYQRIAGFDRGAVNERPF